MKHIWPDLRARNACWCEQIDLPVKLAEFRTVDICCLSGQEFEALKDAIKDLIWSGEIKAEMLQVMINSRHQDELNRACAAAQRMIEALRSNVTLELAALDCASPSMPSAKLSAKRRRKTCSTPFSASFASESNGSKFNANRCGCAEWQQRRNGSSNPHQVPTLNPCFWLIL